MQQVLVTTSGDTSGASAADIVAGVHEFTARRQLISLPRTASDLQSPVSATLTSIATPAASAGIDPLKYSRNNRQTE